MKKPQNKTDYPEKIMQFLKKYWLFITAILIGYPYLRRYIESQSQKTDEAVLENSVKEKEANVNYVKEIKLIDNTNPLTQNSKRLKITASKDLHAASQSLASDFGVQYSDKGNWYDFLNPRGWTENDLNIRKTLVLYRNYFPILEKLYFEVDTNSRSLRKDILQYLDKGELTYLRKYLKI